MAFSQWVEIDTVDGAQSIYALKEMLKQAGWVVSSSSDGTTYNATGDEITHGGSGAGGMANNRAWFRISNPNDVEYVIQRSTSLNYQYRVKCSPANRFIGGSPNATTVPSATDEGILLGGGTDASPSFETWFSTTSNFRYKAGADSASPYHFWAVAIPIGGGSANHVFVHEGLDATEPTDGAPFHTLIGSSDPQDSNISNESESGNTTRSFGTVPSTTPSTWVVIPALTYNSTSGQAVPLLPTNPITGKDESFPIPYARRTASGNAGWKGVGSMMRWATPSRSNGDTLTISSSRDRIIFGDISLPWQGTVPTV